MHSQASGPFMYSSTVFLSGFLISTFHSLWCFLSQYAHMCTYNRMHMHVLELFENMHNYCIFLDVDVTIILSAVCFYWTTKIIVYFKNTYWFCQTVLSGKLDWPSSSGVMWRRTSCKMLHFYIFLPKFVLLSWKSFVFAVSEAMNNN